MNEQPARQQLVDAFRPLRVADVRDGMDWMMLHGMGSVAPEIRPLWRTRMCGIARTVRYVPTDKVVPHMSPEEYTQFVSDWYARIATYPFQSDIQPDDVVVVDASDTNVGIIGSNNGLDWIARGASGIVTNGGARDTDELILQQVPVFSRYCSQTMVQGRVEFQAKDVPVEIGGALVRPGDVIVADGDGVVCVPAEQALEVARYARQELDKDRLGRRRLYEQLGRPLDDTV